MIEHGVNPIVPVAQSGPTGGHRSPATPRPAFEEQPPEQVQHELDMAQQVIDELAAQNVHLHFEVDGDGGRVRVQMLDREGQVIREIPARSLLDAISGGGLLLDQTG